MTGLPEATHIVFDEDGPVLVARLGYDGFVATGFVSEPDTAQLLSRFGDRPGLGSTPMSTFEAARTLSSRGATALEWIDVQRFGRFAVRLEEAGNEFPTMVVGVDDWGRPLPGDEHAAVTRVGARTVPPNSFLWWSRFDIIDRAASIFVDDSEPFVGWMNGSPFFELVQGDAAELWFGQEPILGPYGSADGTLAFFTKPFYAKHFMDTFYGQTRAMVTNAADLEASWRLVEVRDLAARLSTRQHPMPISVVINPGAPRSMIGVVHGTHSPLVQNVKAFYALQAGNVLAFHDTAEVWNGYGTLHWSGGSSFIEQRLGKTFAAAPMGELGHHPSDLTDLELDELVSEFLEQPIGSLTPVEASELPVTEVFLVSAWDTVTGLAATEAFRGFASAVSWLVEYERGVDRQARTGGAQGCWQLGFSGSDDQQREAATGEAFRAALRSTLVRSARRGYSADDNASVITLCNTVLRSLQLETMGYCADLAWRLSADEGQLETLEEREGFPLEPGELQQWVDTVTLEPDASKIIEVRNRLGSATELLEPKSRLFLATALGDREARGNSPLMDYSPVSVGIVKALETELVEVLAAFADHQQPADLYVDALSGNDRLLHSFINDRSRRPTLGQMRHLLKAPDGDMHRVWLDFVDSLPEGRELRSSRFREFLHKASLRYRNGGAHDSAIPRATAEACVSEVLGEPGSPGKLSLVANAKYSARAIKNV